MDASGSLLRSLRKREFDEMNESTDSLNLSCDKLTQTHVLNDVFYAYRFNLSPETTHIIRNHNFIAFHDAGRIVLYDLIARERMWVCPFVIREDYRLRELIVSPDGIVLALTTDHGFGGKHDCHIFFEGNQTGIIDIESISAQTIKLMNRRLYALTTTVHKKSIHIWDIHGKKTSEIPLLDRFCRGVRNSFELNSNFYVLTGLDACLDLDSDVFVYDLITEKTKVFHLDKCEGRPLVSSVIIQKLTALIGISYKEGRNMGLRYPKITELNVLTGKIEKQHHLEYNKGEIKQLIANDDYIVFLLYEGANPDYLWVIDRQNGEQKRILPIPLCPDQEIKMSISGHILNVCYRTGSWSIGSALHKLCVFDLLESEIVKRVFFRRYPWHEMTLQDGKLVIVDTISEVNSIYVEDFQQVHGNEEQTKTLRIN